MKYIYHITESRLSYTCIPSKTSIARQLHIAEREISRVKAYESLPHNKAKWRHVILYRVAETQAVWHSTPSWGWGQGLTMLENKPQQYKAKQYTEKVQKRRSVPVSKSATVHFARVTSQEGGPALAQTIASCNLCGTRTGPLTAPNRSKSVDSYHYTIGVM